MSVVAEGVVPKSSLNHDGPASDNDDDEEDEDYRPEPTTNSVKDNRIAISSTQQDDTNSHHHLSTMQTLAVDQAFERLFGYSWGTCFELPPVLTPEQRMLVQIFGPEVAASMSRYVGKQSKHQTQISKRSPIRDSIFQRTSPSSQPNDNTNQNSPPTELLPKATQAISKDSQPKPNTAPQSVAPNLGGSVAVNAATVGGVDKVLSELSGKSSTTTIVKTSEDWERFKESSGLGVTIEEKAQSKDSYLHRQDFLTRVDHRRFEVEKEGRDRERAKRGT